LISFDDSLRFGSELSSAADVGVYSAGRTAELLHGAMENSDVTREIDALFNLRMADLTSQVCATNIGYFISPAFVS
jgi:alkaline phosphatase